MRLKKRTFYFHFGSLLIVVVAALFTSQTAPGQTIPSCRLFIDAWQNAGCPESTTTYSGYANVKDFGAKGDGKTDDHPAVIAALAKLAGSPGVIYFPAGTYRMASPISLPSRTILRGSSDTASILRFDFVEHAIRIYGTETGPWVTLSVPASISAKTIAVADASAFESGDYAVLRQENDVSWNITDAWAADAAGQIIRITAVSGNILSLERPLRHDYPLSRQPQVRKIFPNLGSGVENLKLERLLAGDNASRNNQYTIHFSCAAQGFVRNVHSYKAFGSHIALDLSTQITIHGCYLEDAHEYDDGGSGYGVKIQSRSGECLIENNIFRQLRHSILLQSGANGNVIGYNYSRDTKSDSHPSWAGDICLHGNYPYANLFEGNIVEHIWIDDSHDGINGPLNMFFRNRAEKCGFNMTDPGASSQNVIGNELFQGGTAAQIAVGNGYHFEATDHFTYGNMTKAEGLQPVGTKSLPTLSYYLTGLPSVLPSWWSILDEPPVIGPEHDLSVTKNNPARARYFERYGSIASADGGGGGGCFIATAAFGSDFDPSVRTLRRFRDGVLLKCAAGKALVNFYYTVSPPLAGIIAQSKSLRLVVSILLTPIVAIAFLWMAAGPVAVLWLLVLMVWASRAFIRRRKHRTNPVYARGGMDRF